VATVIASQSIISGAYSMTQQAISLGFLPRMKVVHTEGCQSASKSDPRSASKIDPPCEGLGR
jgi:K+ potassium transporter